MKTGLLDADEIEHFDLWQLAKMVVRIKRLRDEIRRIEEARARRARQAAEAMLGPFEP